MTSHIGRIITTAPIWNGAPEDVLRGIVKELSDASYCFADDRGKEWGLAHDCVARAANMVNTLGLGFVAIEALHRDKPQLMPIDHFIDAVLNDARVTTARIIPAPEPKEARE